MRTPSALIFDFDGTLIDTESVELASLQSMWRTHGLTLDKERWFGFLGLEAPDWVSVLADELPDAADLVELRAALAADQRARSMRQPLRPGVRELFDLAVRHDIRLAISSNADRGRVNQVLTDKGLSDTFDVVVTREDVNQGKPAPDAYLRACSLLEAGPSECIAFEDSGPGMASAIAAGLRCVAVPTPFTTTHDFSAADIVVNDLSEISHSEIVEGRLRTVDH